MREVSQTRPYSEARLMAIEAAICQTGGMLTETRTYMMIGEVSGNIESQKASGVLGSRMMAHGEDHAQDQRQRDRELQLLRLFVAVDHRSDGCVQTGVGGIAEHEKDWEQDEHGGGDMGVLHAVPDDLVRHGEAAAAQNRRPRRPRCRSG